MELKYHRETYYKIYRLVEREINPRESHSKIFLSCRNGISFKLTPIQRLIRANVSSYIRDEIIKARLAEDEIFFIT